MQGACIGSLRLSVNKNRGNWVEERELKKTKNRKKYDRKIEIEIWISLNHCFFLQRSFDEINHFKYLYLFHFLVLCPQIGKDSHVNEQF